MLSLFTWTVAMSEVPEFVGVVYQFVAVSLALVFDAVAKQDIHGREQSHHGQQYDRPSNEGCLADRRLLFQEAKEIRNW